MRVVFKWKCWVFFFSIGGKGGISNFHSEVEELERELCVGVSKLGRDQNPVWGLVVLFPS